MILTLPSVYSQWDVRWSQDVLGFNKEPQYNIYNYGCLISCLAMISSYYGSTVNPQTINNMLKTVKGFNVGGGDYIWGSLTKIYNNIEENKVNTPLTLTNDQINSIKTALDNGYPVMVQLDVNPKTVTLDMHYVLIIGYDPSDENNFIIADPLGGTIDSLKKYLGWWRPSARKTIEQYIIYKGQLLPDTTNLEKKLVEMEKAFINLRENHKKELADKDKECQNRLLEVKKIMQEAVNKL